MRRICKVNFASTQNVHGSHELAKKILRKKLSARDENRHLDIKREVNFGMSALVDRYWEQYASKKKSQDREKAIVEGIQGELGRLFVREVDGAGIQRWYGGLTDGKPLSVGTAVRHFNVMHHMMEKAATIWSKETGIDRNPADDVDVKRPDDQRERYLRANSDAARAACLCAKSRWTTKSLDSDNELGGLPWACKLPFFDSAQPEGKPISKKRNCS